jgi:hypothetical protein
MQSECVVAITLVVCRLSQQRACTQSCLQAGYCLSIVYGKETSYLNDLKNDPNAEQPIKTHLDEA